MVSWIVSEPFWLMVMSEVKVWMYSEGDWAREMEGRNKRKEKSDRRVKRNKFEQRSERGFERLWWVFIVWVNCWFLGFLQRNRWSSMQLLLLMFDYLVSNFQSQGRWFDYRKSLENVEGVAGILGEVSDVFGLDWLDAGKTGTLMAPIDELLEVMSAAFGLDVDRSVGLVLDKSCKV